jgi:predicted hydrocarbon binding protein
MIASSVQETDASPRVKGFAIRGLLKYVKHSGWSGGIPRILATLSAEERSCFSERILSSSWYPYVAFTSLLQAIDREIGDDDLSSLCQVGESSGRHDAGAIFKIVRSLSSIERVIAGANLYWRRYCDRGRFEVVEVSSGRVQLRLHDFPDIHPGHCELITGWIKGLGLSAGARDAETRQHKCVHRGDPYCEFHATWS